MVDPPTDSSMEFLVQVSHQKKLIEILKKLSSHEVILYSEASEEFVSLLNQDNGGDVLREYVQSSPKLVELAETWNLHRGKPGMKHILSLISNILEHPYGKGPASAISRSLDSFARTIISSHLDDIYTELNSKEYKRQSAALMLLAAIVRRNTGIASEVAKTFDFKLPIFSKLSGVKKKDKMAKEAKKGVTCSTRKAFIQFAMSFIEVGNPRLLRWILQQKEMYSGVLRGVGNDDEETVVFVLTTIRDRILIEESLVPPGLRSVLFGSATLEQLAYVSGNAMMGGAADVAHDVLVKVCTDHINGLMPGPNLKGNEKRLFDLMKKLKATEFRHHKHLLLAIASRSPLLCSYYMDDFPYNLEPRPSSIWFSAVSLAAEMISSVNMNFLIQSISSRSFENMVDAKDKEIQNIMSCIVPRSFTRSVINKGLLHSDTIVKNASLRILLASLKSLDNLLSEIENKAENYHKDARLPSYGSIPSLYEGQGASSSRNYNSVDANVIGDPSNGDLGWEKLISLKQYIQNIFRAAFPDMQVLLKLLPSSGDGSEKVTGTSLKRCSKFIESRSKKARTAAMDGDIDIVVGGIDVIPEDKEELNHETVVEDMLTVADIWALNEHPKGNNRDMDGWSIFHTKLLDVLSLYLRAMPNSLDGSFDFLKLLFVPSNLLGLSNDHLQSLVSLLIAYIQLSRQNMVSHRVLDSSYRYLQPILSILLFSKVKGIRDQAYILAREAMSSTGAFDSNIHEIDAWFLFLPGYSRKLIHADSHKTELLQCSFGSLISFLCDAVSTVGNNLYKYIDNMRKLSSQLSSIEDHSPGFSPLVVCILQKCLRLLESESSTFKLYEKSLISLYVCNTLKFILEMQVDMRSLAGLIQLILSEKFKEFSEGNGNQYFLCEWRPVNNLLSFVHSIMDKKNHNLFYLQDTHISCADSLASVLINVKKFLGQSRPSDLVGLATAFASSFVCSSLDEVVVNFDELINVAHLIFGSDYSLLDSVVYVDTMFLYKVANERPNVFYSSLEIIKTTISGNCKQKASDSHSGQETASNFGLYLKSAPFYILFYGILSLGRSKSDPTSMQDLSCLSRLKELLRFTVSRCHFHESILYLRYTLFWTHHLLLSCRAKLVYIPEELLQSCFSIMEDILEHLLVEITNVATSRTAGSSSVEYLQEVVDVIFENPVVTLPLANPLCCNEEVSSESLEDDVHAFIAFSERALHPLDEHTVQFVSKVLDTLLGCGIHKGYLFEMPPSIGETVLQSSIQLINKAALLFKGNFGLCVTRKKMGPLLCSFSIFRFLMRFMSPFQLLELVDWMFSKIEDNSSGSITPFYSSISLSLYVADFALGMMFSFLKQPDLKSNLHLLWNYELQSFDDTILQKIYNEILHFSVSFNLEHANMCLSKVLNGIHVLRFTKPTPTSLPLCLLLLRMVTQTPLKMLIRLLYPTSKLKAKALLELIEVSPVHMGLFGKILCGMVAQGSSILDALDDKCHLYDAATSKKPKPYLSEDDWMLLLPAVMSYLKFNFSKLKEGNKEAFEIVPRFYSKIILGGCLNWKNYVSQNMFLEEYIELDPNSFHSFHYLFRNTLLWNAINMLHYQFLGATSPEEKHRMELFDSLYPHESSLDILLDCGINEIDTFSYKEALTLTNQIVAKISFTKLLLFHPENPIHFVEMEMNKESMVTAAEKTPERLRAARITFMKILVNTLHAIVRKFPERLGTSGAPWSTAHNVFRFLEHLILRNIVKLSVEIQDYYTEEPTFLMPFVESSLSYRFDDPVRLRALRCMLVTLSKGGDAAAKTIEHFLGKSRSSTANLSKDVPDLFVLTSDGMLLQSVPSILKSIKVSLNVEDKQFQFPLEEKKLELVKLLRVAHHLKVTQQMNEHVKDVEDSSELVSVLMSVYGATLSVIDLEILQFLFEIESGPQVMSDMDYLWGAAASKTWKEVTCNSLLQEKVDDCETKEERRKRHFRENIPIVSSLCATTVLHFCYDRASKVQRLSLKSLLQDNTMGNGEGTVYTDLHCAQQYDPEFILRFSIHSLLMGYLDPVEFSRLGLLAITFVSISSDDVEIRKLGYEALGSFKKHLENCRNKDVFQLQLLLTYIQNGIAEPWQKIPSVIAIFAAEASFTLLVTSKYPFLALSKLLMHSPKVNLKTIPLFHTLFESDSVNFKEDRLWILQLLYAGLNSSDDAKIYRRNGLFELLLSFYASSLSDQPSRILILQIVEKAVKINMLIHYLVKECGLLSWLATIISNCGQGLCETPKGVSVKTMELVLKVINDVISKGAITDWLLERALEQLSTISALLQKLIVDSPMFFMHDVPLLNSILHVIISTLRISQKRRIFQPHFTISNQGLFQLCKALDFELCNLKSSLTFELGINTILMSSPPPARTHMDRVRLREIIVWSISCALQMLEKQDRIPDCESLVMPEEQEEETLLSKLLRWLIASVILGGISKINPTRLLTSGDKSLKFLLKNILEQEDNHIYSDDEDGLTDLILHLLQLLGKNCRNLVSAVSALSLLLLQAPNRIRNESPELYCDIEDLCSKIGYPPEANPSWRWSYYQPWKDYSVKQSMVEQMQVEYACQKLLIIFTNSVGGKSPNPLNLSHKDLEHNSLFEWEMNSTLESKSS